MPPRTFALMLAAVILAAGMTLVVLRYLGTMIALPLGLLSLLALILALAVRMRRP